MSRRYRILSALLCVLALGHLAHGQASTSPLSYLTTAPIPLVQEEGVEIIEATEVPVVRLRGPMTILFSSFSGYLIDRESKISASSVFRHRDVDAGLEFFLYPRNRFPFPIDKASAEAHLAHVGEVYKQEFVVEPLHISDPEARVYVRYLGQRPFEVVYRSQPKTPGSGTRAYIFHEVWLDLDSHILVSRLRAPEERYRALLTHAQRIWRDASFR